MTGSVVQGRRLLLSFPSLMGLKKTTTGDNIDAGKIVVNYGGECPQEYPVGGITYAAVSASEPKVALQSPSQAVTLTANSKKAKFQFAVRTSDEFKAPGDLLAAVKEKQAYVLDVKGYAISKMEDPNGVLEAIPNSFSYVVKGGGIVAITVDSPRADQKLSIEVTSPKGVAPVSPLIVEFKGNGVQANAQGAAENGPGTEKPGEKK
jgi:hypothetical protein